MSRARSPKRKTEEKRTRAGPLYHELYVLLRRDLVDGTAQPGRRLPSEPALAARYHVSRVTIRKTLEKLANDGLIKRVRGVGTFPVAGADKSARTNISGYLDTLISVEHRTTAVNLSFARILPDGGAKDALGEAAVLKIVRLRSYNGRPISLTTLWVPDPHAGLVKESDNPNIPTIQHLEERGVVATRTEQAITADRAGPFAAEKLGVDETAPLIVMRRLMLDASAAPVLYQESLYAPDEFEYRMTLMRTSVGPIARWTPLA
ncbi:MAG: GntR family transcriptional regulator [Pseudomonadota bacterium]